MWRWHRTWSLSLNVIYLHLNWTELMQTHGMSYSFCTTWKMTTMQCQRNCLWELQRYMSAGVCWHGDSQNIDLIVTFSAYGSCCAKRMILNWPLVDTMRYNSLISPPETKSKFFCLRVNGQTLIDDSRSWFGRLRDLHQLIKSNESFSRVQFIRSRLAATKCRQKQRIAINWPLNGRATDRIIERLSLWFQVHDYMRFRNEFLVAMVEGGEMICIYQTVPIVITMKSYIILTDWIGVSNPIWHRRWMNEWMWSIDDDV